MPIYTFRCPNGHEHEQWRRIADRDQPSTCAQCGLEATRALDAPSFCVTGFNYKNGYSHKGPNGEK